MLKPFLGHRLSRSQQQAELALGHWPNPALSPVQASPSYHTHLFCPQIFLSFRPPHDPPVTCSGPSGCLPALPVCPWGPPLRATGLVFPEQGSEWPHSP